MGVRGRMGQAFSVLASPYTWRERSAYTHAKHGQACRQGGCRGRGVVSAKYTPARNSFSHHNFIC